MLKHTRCWPQASTRKTPPLPPPPKISLLRILTTLLPSMPHRLHTKSKKRIRVRNAKIYRVYNHGSEERDVERFD
jgi:hypothetical protein